MKDQFKNMILDLPFEEDVQPSKVEKKKSKAILTEGETLIWKGGPNHSRSVFDKNYTPRFLKSRIFKFGDFFSYTFAVTLAILMSGEDFIPVLIMFGLTFPFLPMYHYLIYKKKKSTEYMLTSKKLVFINWNWGIKRIDFIPLSNIKNLKFKENDDFGSVGNIHFKFQNEVSLPYKTRNFANNRTMFSPFFKNVKKMKEIVHLINRHKTKKQKT